MTNIRWLKPPDYVGSVCAKLRKVLGSAEKGVFDTEGGFYVSANLAKTGSAMIVVDRTAGRLTLNITLDDGDVEGINQAQHTLDAFRELVVGKAA